MLLLIHIVLVCRSLLLLPVLVFLVLPAKAPALSTGIRHLIYNAVGMDHTYRSSLTLTIPLIRWLLSETDWMEEEALKLCTYLIRLEQVHNLALGGCTMFWFRRVCRDDSCTSVARRRVVWLTLLVSLGCFLYVIRSNRSSVIMLNNSRFLCGSRLTWRGVRGVVCQTDLMARSFKPFGCCFRRFCVEKTEEI